MSYYKLHVGVRKNVTFIEGGYFGKRNKGIENIIW
jgi:hypothetical protein